MRAGLCVYQLDVGAKLDCWIILSLTLEIDDAELAMLGGYLARSSDPSPGAVTFCLLLIPPMSSGVPHLLENTKDTGSRRCNGKFKMLVLVQAGGDMACKD